MRETFKDIEIKGRKFRIKKFNALLANGILRDLLSTALPINVTDVLPIALPQLGGVINKTMGIKEFAEFQKLILSNTFEVLPAGEMPLFDSQGNFGVIDLEYDMSAVFELLKEVISFNFSGFFAESLSILGIFKEGQSGNLQDMPT